MVHTGIPRRSVIVPAAFLMLPLAVAACAARGAGETPPAAATTPATTAPATPVVPAEVADPPEEAADPPAEAADPPEEAAAARIFTETQADRGRTAFDEVCSECHTSSEFKGRLFQSNWGRRTVYSFYRTIRSTMPDDNPGGLEEQVYLDVVSYLLSQNGHEAGATELSADSPMREVRIAPASGSGSRPNGGIG